MTEIQLNTLLGNFWEQVVANQLTSLGVTYDRSPNLGAGIISPDFVCRKKKSTFFVTCTGSSQSFIKKRWRYINELFQAKGVLGDDMLVANLVLATNANLQEFEQTVFKRLFDIAAFGDDFPDFEKHYLWARSELEAGVEVPELAATFESSPDTKRFRSKLNEWFKGALAATPAKLGGLWKAVEHYQSKRTLNPVVPNDSTYWRWTCLKLLPLTTAERMAVFDGLSGKIIKADPERLTKAGLSAQPVIGGVRVSDEQVKATLDVFSSAQILATLDALDSDNADIGFPLNEVVDKAAVAAAYAAYKPEYSDEKKFSSKALKEFKDPQGDRIRIWEYAVALADTSLLDINKEYVKRWGKIVVANPINNVILKTDIGHAIAKVADIKEVIDRASSIFWKRLPARITEALFTDRVMDYRRRSLFLQPYLNPTQRRFEQVCNKVLKAVPVLSNFDGLLGDLGVSGRASRVEALYVFPVKKKTWIFKVLAGYKGGYEHKADEMASRAWLLRFRIDQKKKAAFAAPVRLVFVYEGEWDEKYLSLLHASGWDDIVHLSQVKTFLEDNIV